MAFGTPYLIGTTGAASTATSQSIVIATGTTAGDIILVATGNSSSSGATVTGVTDSHSNVYLPSLTASVSNEFGQVWIAAYGSCGPGTNTTALTTANTITVTYSATSGEKVCIAVGVTGGSNAGNGSWDVTAIKAGTSAAPSVTTEYMGNAGEM